MGGKPWSEQEERIFWREIARRAPPGLVANGRRRHRTADTERSWVPLAQRMKERMEEVAPGKPHREYNFIKLYEHYHHNYLKNRDNGRVTYSPNARRFVKEYQAWVNQMQAAENRGAASNDNIVMTPQLHAQATHHQQTPQPHLNQARAPQLQAQATHQLISQPCLTMSQTQALQLRAQAARRQRISQPHLTQMQAPTQSMSTQGARDSFQGAEDFNRPMHAPPTTQNHGNMGHGGFVSLPNEYPRYNLAQARGSTNTHGQHYGYPRYSLARDGGNPSTHGQAHGYPGYNYAPARSPSTHGQDHEYPGYKYAQARSPGTHSQADGSYDWSTDDFSEGQLLHGGGSTLRASQASDDVDTAYAAGQSFGNGDHAGAGQHENNNFSS